MKRLLLLAITAAVSCMFLTACMSEASLEEAATIPEDISIEYVTPDGEAVPEQDTSQESDTSENETITDSGDSEETTSEEISTENN